MSTTPCRQRRALGLALLGAHALKYCEDAPEMLETMLAIHQPKPPRFPQWPQPRAATTCDGDGSAATASLLVEAATMKIKHLLKTPTMLVRPDRTAVRVGGPHCVRECGQTYPRRDEDEVKGDG